MTLLILAAGMGSRFGGLKQLEPMGPNGEFIIDYSVYDAKKAGFTKIVFVIKEEMYDLFKESIGSRVEPHIEVEYVFQKMEDIPVEIDVLRIKPWGTGQAILAARDVIDENFAIINADDFYGRNAFLKAYEFLKYNHENEFGLVGYRAVNTLTENGSVKRGVCKIVEGKLNGIIESSIEKSGDHIHCKSLSNGKEFDIEDNRLVSMNMLLFTPKIFDYLEKDFVEFFKDIKDKEKDEFLIPEVIDKHIKNGDITVDVIETDSVWYGVTYKEDTIGVKNAICNLVSSGEYNNNLWG
ncbi:MAG: NTP transferase domain-containing protein [Bacilli bacterium]|nr:NTP transferase domain-containing protein [Bacilli bacterium]